MLIEHANFDSVIGKSIKSVEVLRYDELYITFMDGSQMQIEAVTLNGPYESSPSMRVDIVKAGEIK